MVVSNNPSRTQVLETFVVFAVCSLLAGLFFEWKSFVWAALLLLVLSLTAKKPAAVVTHGWLRIAELIAAANSKIILILLFFFVLTPLAFVYRLFNKDSLNLRMDQADSYFSERNHTYDKADLRKMW